MRKAEKIESCTYRQFGRRFAGVDLNILPAVQVQGQAACFCPRSLCFEHSEPGAAYEALTILWQACPAQQRFQCTDLQGS